MMEQPVEEFSWTPHSQVEQQGDPVYFSMDLESFLCLSKKYKVTAIPTAIIVIRIIRFVCISGL
jgi:hypothetical protein